ncbi:MAG: hypothetical protein ACLFPL_03465 [Candidatus Nanoarchaeia archaeon]
MAKQKGITLPSGQGGLIGGVAESYKTNYDFSPKFVIVFSLLVVLFVFLLFRLS